MRTVEILDSSGATHRPVILDAPGGGSGFGRKMTSSPHSCKEDSPSFLDSKMVRGTGCSHVWKTRSPTFETPPGKRIEGWRTWAYDPCEPLALLPERRP